MTHLRRTWGERTILAVNVVAIVASLAAAWSLSKVEQAVASIDRVALEGSLTPRLPVDDGGGEAFNVLLVGYDSAANLDPDDPVQIGRQGERFGDVIIVARIDEANETVRLLSIPRDLWVPIAGLGEERKINQAFAVGGAGTLIDTIEDNLGIPINNFISVDLSGFEGLVEVVDHVDLFFRRPARDFNPSPPSGEPRSMSGFEMLESGCRSLGPDQALAFVRSRNFQIYPSDADGDISDDDAWVVDGERSDLSRIRRQQTFLEAFIVRAIDLGARNPFVLADLIDEGVKHVTLDQDITPQMLLDIGQAFQSFEPGDLESYSLPTQFEWRNNRTVSVVVLREEELPPLALLMQGVPADDPRTIGVSIERSAEAEATSLDRLADALDRAGFVVPDPVIRTVSSAGVAIRHGLDGVDAAATVRETLVNANVAFDAIELDPTIRGREIVIAVGAPSGETTTTSSPPTTAVDPSVSGEEPTTADGRPVGTTAAEQPTGTDSTGTDSTSAAAPRPEPIEESVGLCR